jgi:diguanylate cyclase (GGDEF)-like protein
MFLFFRRRKEIYALMFSAFLLVFAGYSFFSSAAIYEILVNTAIIRRMMYSDIIICVPLISLCFWNYLWPGRPPSMVLKLTTVVCTMGMFLILLLPYRWIDTIFRIYIYPITAVLVYIFALAMLAVRVHIIETRNIVIASLVIVGIGFFSFLDEIYFKTGVDLISWAPLFLCVIYASILTTRYWEMGVELVDKNQQLQRNAAQLEEIVQRRTEELSDAKQELENRLAEITLLQSTLNEQVMRDPLTGLYNRRYMEESLKKEFARAERKDYPISMVMFDIDHFKLLNDAYSHSAGDQVLISLGRILSTHIRIDDYAIRYGGEEFLVIFPQTPYIKALVRANQIRELVKKVVVEYLGNQLQISVSGGVAGYPDHGRTPEDVIKNADRALYKAKELGRDRVEVYLNGEDMPKSELTRVRHGLQTYE